MTGSLGATRLVFGAVCRILRWRLICMMRGFRGVVVVVRDIVRHRIEQPTPKSAQSVRAVRRMWNAMVIVRTWCGGMCALQSPNIFASAMRCEFDEAQCVPGARSQMGPLRHASSIAWHRGPLRGADLCVLHGCTHSVTQCPTLAMAPKTCGHPPQATYIAIAGPRSATSGNSARTAIQL